MKFGCVSVIISCWNQEQRLAGAIESVLAQTCDDVEIVVVDDGSTDRTRSVIDRYSEVKYCYQPQQGMAAARNTGLKISSGEYLVFLNPENRLLPKALEVGVRCLEAMPSCGFSMGLYRISGISGLSLRSAEELMEQVQGGSVYRSLLGGRSPKPLDRLMFRRSLFDEIAPFDLSLSPAEEYDLCLRAAARFPVCSHNQAVVEVRERSVVRSCSRLLLTHLEALNRQKDILKRDRGHKLAIRQGKHRWRTIYGVGLTPELKGAMQQRNWLAAVDLLKLLLSYYPQGVPLVVRSVVERLRRRLRFFALRSGLPRVE